MAVGEEGGRGGHLLALALVVRETVHGASLRRFVYYLSRETKKKEIVYSYETDKRQNVQLHISSQYDEWFDRDGTLVHPALSIGSRCSLWTEVTFMFRGDSRSRFSLKRTGVNPRSD
ncbi:hypothetical protein HRR83_001433 [Exophiala dermatitidis]|uniref:Uncharacterized protein n=1 Tax=Exophiala dermatitidis TaxID=5970 RepID=A0AAN6F3C2_EXODE|nr:hypothetical protein HRR74_001437 [Exophiala dermatitidis]KAJ4526816.1 hypothetical protein HRR73_001611 [Exophiala dermatitidis]KAJ4532524.1 hypothetical protein HRR76_007513 [Exophiala dermatitidis]KAJ4546966.1 hypothetical protein HRR77_004506 [Exophiala dermatitidis]KAJ4573674.1 hypothetical protein HRR79_002685 [Exophiala dermatitidis]